MGSEIELSDDCSKDHKWVVLSGSHSVGKTTLLEEVKSRNPEIQVMKEVARILLAEKNWTKADIEPGPYPENFRILNREILVRQVGEFGKLDPNNWAIVDRGLDALGYLKLYLGDRQFQAAISAPPARELIQIMRENCQVVVIEPQLCLVEVDGIRISSTFRDMLDLHKTILDVYRCLEIQVTLIKPLYLPTRVGIIEDMIGVAKQ